MYSNRLKASAYNIREHQKTEEKDIVEAAIGCSSSDY